MWGYGFGPSQRALRAWSSAAGMVVVVRNAPNDDGLHKAARRTKSGDPVNSERAPKSSDALANPKSRFPIPGYLSEIEYAGSFFGTSTFFSVT